MSILDNVYNYYEKLVLEELATQLGEDQKDDDFLTDTVCVALNHLPGRYFRHGVDMAFYLTSDEYVDMKKQVTKAVKDALAYMKDPSRDK
ncbi:competence protein ComFB [Hahella sp. CCB-MM4]|uniref:late competence development ComFB family protein n=1 Tax=Hahella sp. (strain CCB-MM4) TaxID=1926491 RepID=UPI000B9C1518|nr:late competence development ComFB family protein [Hahella sp. CCB-MM4]OZG70125.1 competence protein ComFB [Hahella sp. CCB-MM4]